MKALFIGGTGTISSACVELAIARGIDLVLLNRGQAARHIPEGVKVLQGDIRDQATISRLLNDMTFMWWWTLLPSPRNTSRRI